MKEECLFCKIIQNQVPSKVVYEDNEVIAILDAFPDCDGHTLVIPKKHVTDINEANPDLLMHMFDVAKKLAPDIMAKLNKKALTYLINYGDSQAIKHLHLHLLPDYRCHKAKMTTDEVYKILKG